MCIAKTAKRFLDLNSQKKAIATELEKLRPILEAEMNRRKEDKITLVADDLHIRISYILQSRKGLDVKGLQETHPAIYSQFEKETIFPVLRVMA